jgi:hypothetical protein
LGFNDFFGQFYGVTKEGRMVKAYVHRNNGSQGAVSVSYRTENGSARANNDFALTSGTLHWTDGDTQAKQIKVQTLEDSAAEGDERFVIRLSDPTGGVTFEQIFGGPNDHRIVIIGDDDAAAGRGDGARE